jgi:N-acetylgalactosamine-6-sulfatase
MRWPGKIPANTTCDQVSVTFDLTKSLLRCAGASSADLRLEGYDIVEHVVSGKADFSRTLFWRGKRGQRTWAAVRHGDMKYIRKTDGSEQEQWLFDLAEDVGEANDLLSAQTDTARQLQRMLQQWEADVTPTR